MNAHESNINRLRAILDGFGISISELKITGFSQPYCSRLIAGDKKCSSPKFFEVLEQNLGKLIDARKRRIFDLPSIAADDLINSLKSI